MVQVMEAPCDVGVIGEEHAQEECDGGYRKDPGAELHGEEYEQAEQDGAAEHEQEGFDNKGFPAGPAAERKDVSFLEAEEEYRDGEDDDRQPEGKEHAQLNGPGDE